MQRRALPHRLPMMQARARRRATARSPPSLADDEASWSIAESEWLHLVGEASATRARATRGPRALSDACASSSKVADQSGKSTTTATYKHGSLGDVAGRVHLI